jgi:hypothetical protein
MSEIERALRFEEQRARLFQDYAQSSYVNMRRLVDEGKPERAIGWQKDAAAQSWAARGATAIACRLKALIDLNRKRGEA